MKKFLGVLVGAIFIFGLVQGTVLAAQAKNNGLSEERKIDIIIEVIQDDAFQKMAQDMALLQLSFQLETERDAAAEIIKRLEKFQTNDATISEKISKSWLPTLKKHLKAVENTLAAVEKFMERKDLIYREEIEAEFLKYYPPELDARINQVLQEMHGTGMLQKLLQD
ncbi:MAG: hypothetical protein Q8L57_02880 [bacterium]|nr:hypothetical protein [bacterium]